MTATDVILPGPEKLHRPQPDFLSVSPNGRIAHIRKANDEYASVDVFLITAVEQNSNGHPKRRK